LGRGSGGEGDRSIEKSFVLRRRSVAPDALERYGYHSRGAERRWVNPNVPVQHLFLRSPRRDAVSRQRLVDPRVLLPGRREAGRHAILKAMDTWRRIPRLLRALLVGLLGVAILAALFVPVLLHIRGKFRGAMCMKNMIQIRVAWSMYAADYDDHAMPLATGEPAPPGALVPGAQTWWPDLLTPYMSYRLIYSCPDRPRWGIGMNRPEIGRWLGGGPSLDTMARPEETIVFADSGLVTNPDDPNPDRWTEGAGAGPLHFRTPNDLPGYNRDPCRVVNRHDGIANVALADGRVVPRRAGQLGFQYPKGDRRAMWDLEVKRRRPGSR
jgi:hypothetical protein